MRNIKQYIFLAAITMGLTAKADAHGNPSSILIKVFEIRLSKNSDCSNSVSIFKTASPAAADFAANPNLGSGVLPMGTYHCMAIHLSDIITVTPATSEGTVCTAGTPFTTDIFNTPAQGDISVDPVTGALINGRGDPVAPLIEDDPWVYFSDATGASSSNNCYRPTVVSAGQGPCLLSALPVTGNQTRTIVYDFDGVVGDYGNGHCQLGPPVISIR
jgi:hypothetical protein